MAKKRSKKSASKPNDNGAALGFEEKLWASADKLRGSIDAAEYKHVVLGLLFLKYISDAFQARREELEALTTDPNSDYFTDGDKDWANQTLEDRDEYASKNVFWVPPEARWKQLQAQAKRPDIAKLIDDGMYAIERDNPRLKNVLPRDYARRGIPAERLGELIDLISGIGLGDKESRAKDILGRVYEYFLGKFAAAEGKLGGEFYTPRSIVKLLVEMIEPFKGRVYDPACGSGGMFVQAERFVEAHEGKATDISIYGQESNPTTWKLANMNLALRGIEAHLGEKHADTFHNDLHKDLKADFILANPPFNVSDWGGERRREDVRWKYGTPPVGNANYAWIQHFIHHLAPNGIAGFVMVNAAMTSASSQERAAREAMVREGLVDCVVALPGHLFYTMYSPVCIWIMRRSRKAHDRTLFIDARDLGNMVERTHRELSDDDINLVASTYTSWRDDPSSGNGHAVPGFCMTASIADIERKSFALDPAKYVGSPIESEDGDEWASASIPDLAQVVNSHITAVTEHVERLGAGMRLLAGSPPESLPLSVAYHLDLPRLLNETLTAQSHLAIGLYRRWFVDYVPVIENDTQADACVPDKYKSLFPSSLTSSLLGDVPTGWRVGTFREFLRPRSERIGDQEAPEYSATVRGLERRDLRFNKSLARSSAKNKKICRDDIVFGLSRRTLNFGVMREAIGSVSPVYEVFAVDTGLYLPVLLELHMRFNIKGYIDILKLGAREGAPIDREYLMGKDILIPPIDVQHAFVELAYGVASS